MSIYYTFLFNLYATNIADWCGMVAYTNVAKECARVERQVYLRAGRAGSV